MFARFAFVLGLAALLVAAPAAPVSAQRPPEPSPGAPATPSTPPAEPPRPADTPADRSGDREPAGTPGRPRVIGLRAIVGPTCFRPGDLIMIEGDGLDAARGFLLTRELAPERMPLPVVSWQGSRVIARLSADRRLAGGRRYRLILTDRQNRTVGNPAGLPLELCQAPPAPERSAGGQQPDTAVPGEVTLLLAAGGSDPAPVIAALGYGIAERVQLAALGQEILRLTVPAGRTLTDAVDELRTALPGAAVDVNALYALQAAPRVYARRAIGWPHNSFDCAAGGRGGRIGLIDGAIDVSHPALAAQDIVVRSFLAEGQAPGSRDHATGIASILVGRAGAGDEWGLLPAARLYVAEVFRARSNGAARTTTLTVAVALDWLAGETLRVVNLSFAGPGNAVLAASLAQAAHRGMILVAASGNNGPAAPPAYPAADASVIAVTALDAANRLYGKANRGDYVDFAAPGVDIWVAQSGASGAYRSGTSFAAPFVTALAAAELARNPRLPAGLLKEGLRNRAVDLGAAGKDTLFGWGLVRASSACAG